MTDKATFHTESIQHHLEALTALLASHTQPTHEGPRTFGKHDFTGYSVQTLDDCIAILSKCSTLPGPLRIVLNALEAARKLSSDPVKLAASATVLRGLINQTKSD